MSRKILPKIALLSALLLQTTSAQLLSCSDIHCPMSFGSAKCNIDETTFTEIGVANFSSSLSPHPLTWTVGFAPKAITNSTDERRYYLSTPRGLGLDTRTDITGCVLFFIGIEGGLSFVPYKTGIELGTVSGTCADALGSTCVADVTSQAQGLAANSTRLGDSECSSIALALQSSPPESCTKAGTWGNIIAKAITGSSIPTPLKLDGCIPTINTTYDVRSVATFPNLGDGPFINDITPLLTIFSATRQAKSLMASPEVSLECMKPMEDVLANQVVSGRSGRTLAQRDSWSSMLAAPIAILTIVLFMS